MAANDPVRVVAPPRRVRRLDRGRGMNERDDYRAGVGQSIAGS